MTSLRSEVRAVDVDGKHFDIVAIGSGFGSSFFLHEALQHNRAGRVLVLEWGQVRDHASQLEMKSHSAISPGATFTNKSPKPWNFTVGFGGGTNCWFGQTPRFHPNDFRLKTRYGVGSDWPIDYDELEAYYCDAEDVMSISGDPDMARVLPRSRPFPQAPHRPSTPDRLLKEARPDYHFVMPTARARFATKTRAGCCASLRCNLCPVDAKFTANNGMMHVFQHPAVSICLGANVLRLNQRSGTIDEVEFEVAGRMYRVSADLFVLGANAIHSPAILQRSGLADTLVGRGLHEAHGVEVEVLLDGVDNFDGSTITTGLDYGGYDGDFRRAAGSALVHFENRWKFGFRTERGKWRQTLPLIIVAEAMPEDSDHVVAASDGPVEVVTGPVGQYALSGIERAMKILPDMLRSLPVEGIEARGERPTESHLQGTMRMGWDPKHSVVDAGQIHHRYRNLVVVGSSVFASCTAANPSLTVAALSLRAARRVMA